MKAKEANILSFRVLFDTKGNLVTEVGGLPLEDANKVFKGSPLISVTNCPLVSKRIRNDNMFASFAFIFISP